MYLMIYLRNKRSYRQHPIGVLLCSSVGMYVGSQTCFKGPLEVALLGLVLAEMHL